MGDHIRKRRLNPGLLQKDVAERVGVSESTMYLWEKNRNNPKPLAHLFEKIIEFLGYHPY